MIAPETSITALIITELTLKEVIPKLIGKENL